MLTIEQCRAARGLLGWTQKDLADSCGLSKTAINNFEKGHSDIKAESLNAVQMAFESADIEFLADQGLRKKLDKSSIIKGPNSMAQLLDDVYYTLKNTGGELLITNTNEARHPQNKPENLIQERSRLKKAGITERVIYNEKITNKWGNNSESCRIIPNGNHDNTNMTSFIYGKKVALEMWNQSMIVIIDSPDAHTSEQDRFETIWESAAQSLKDEAKGKKAQEA